MTLSLSTWIFLIAAAATLPQIYQTLTTGLTRDLNGWNLTLNLVTNMLLAVHGYLQRDGGILLLGAWFTAYWGCLLVLKSYNEKYGQKN